MEQGAVEPTIEELQAQVDEQKARKLQAFIAEIQATCERYGGMIEPQITLTKDGVKCDLIFGVR